MPFLNCFNGYETYMPDIHVRKLKNTVWLSLDNPPLNSLTLEMLEQLATALHAVPQQAPQLVVLSGEGEQAFCAGIDLSYDKEETRTQLLHYADIVCGAFRALYSRHIPSVALVKGIAFGAGCELAALCDVVIAREDARFRLPPVNAKVFLDATSLYLPTEIGQEQTTRLMQSGETQNAQQALRLGLAHQVLANRNFLPDTEELLLMIATSRAR